MMDRLPTGNEISPPTQVRQVKKSFEENDELLHCIVPLEIQHFFLIFNTIEIFSLFSDKYTSHFNY